MKRVLIDTDVGVDDALALALVLASDDLEIVGITTVGGNVALEECTANVFTILEALSPRVVPPVARGAASPLSRQLTTAAHVHGEDGLGNITRLPRYPTPEVSLAPQSASDFIVDQAGELGRDLTIITLGPLTNVATAIRNNSEAMRGVGEILIMGGAFRVYGNTSPVSEFNVFVDPEAAAEVAEFDVPKTFVPLDVTEQVKLMRSDLEARFVANPSRRMAFVRDVSAFYMDFHAENDGFDGCYMHDPTTVALAIDPSLGRTVPAEVHVEASGQHTSGMTVADLRPDKLARYAPNSRVCVEIDAARCLELFFALVATEA